MRIRALADDQKKKLLVRSLLFLMGITRMQDQRPIKVSLQNVQAGRGTIKGKIPVGYFLIRGLNGDVPMDEVAFSRLD